MHSISAADNYKMDKKLMLQHKTFWNCFSVGFFEWALLYGMLDKPFQLKIFCDPMFLD